MIQPGGGIFLPPEQGGQVCKHPAGRGELLLKTRRPGEGGARPMMLGSSVKNAMMVPPNQGFSRR